MAEFVLEHAALRWSVVVAFLFASAIVLVRVGNPVRSQANPVSLHESDAGHLVMCLVMLAMLVFPAGMDPHALHGVLVAMAVAFAALLISRIAEWHNGNRTLSVDRMVALGYHIVAAAAMLYAMSGHGAGGHADGPSPGAACGLAVLFTADAVAVILAVRTGRPWLGHSMCLGAGSLFARALSTAVVPHAVMGLGTAYMLIAAVSG